MRTLNTQFSYLNAAINDLSSCIRFMDTKVAAIIAADMLLLTALISKDIDFLSLIKNFDFSCCKIILWIATCCFIYNTARVYYVGISTLLARIAKTEGSIDIVGAKSGRKNTTNIERSSWFISEDCYQIEDYLSDFENKTSESLIQEMAKELYKLNGINRVKMRKANAVLKSFGLSLISAVAIILLAFAEPYLYTQTTQTVGISHDVMSATEYRETSQDIK